VLKFFDEVSVIFPVKGAQKDDRGGKQENLTQRGHAVEGKSVVYLGFNRASRIRDRVVV